MPVCQWFAGFCVFAKRKPKLQYALLNFYLSYNDKRGNLETGKLINVTDFKLIGKMGESFVCTTGAAGNEIEIYLLLNELIPLNSILIYSVP